MLLVSVCAYGQGQRDADAKVKEASGLIRKGDVSSAKAILLDAQKIYEKLGETVIPEYATNLHLLGKCSLQTDATAAARYASAAVDLRRKLVGAESEEYLESCHVLATAYHDIGKNAEALELHKQVVETAKKIKLEEKAIAPYLIGYGADLASEEDYVNALKVMDEALKGVVKFSPTYDGLLDKMIAIAGVSGNTKRLNRYKSLKMESDIENGRIEPPVVVVEQPKEEKAAVKEEVKQEVKEDKPEVKEEKSEVKVTKKKEKKKNSRKQKRDKKVNPQPRVMDF